MTNFLLVDAPNFVLLASSSKRCLHHLGMPSYLNSMFDEVIGLLGDSVDFDQLTAPVAFEGKSARMMRAVLAQYGFDLPPLTVAELLGFFEYCDRFDALTGMGVFDPVQRAWWQSICCGLGSSRRTPCRLSIEMYTQGDTHGLVRLHRQRQTLACLGRDYRAVEF
jgi:hypothetical protein